MKSKRDSEEYSFQHVKERAEQRYQLEITEKEYKELSQTARRFMVKKQGSGISLVSQEQNGDDIQYVLLIPFKGKNILTVFSKNRDRVTTLLPPGD